MQNTPLVSVLMTAYNREKFIAEAIMSVLNSSYTNLELIVVDDGSKDKTVQIVQEIASVDNRLRFYQNEKNLGDYPNRNRTSSYANGKYMFWCDSDDMLLQQSIEKAVGLMEQFPEADFAICYDPADGKPCLMNSKNIIQDHFFKYPLLMKGPGGTVIKTAYFRSLNGFPEKYGPANDMYFNLKAASRANTLLLPFELIFYRRHDGQEINNQYSYLFNNYRYLADALNELDLPLEKSQEKFLTNKNKRRFVVNIFSFFKKTRDLKKTRSAWKNAGFSIADALQGIFH